ncbi:MAG: methyltransferase [Myxococcota bacterium]|nr:methyltransferase [Myxococcota bacterium]
MSNPPPSLQYPKPILDANASRSSAHLSTHTLAQHLYSGHRVSLQDRYAKGERILSDLRLLLAAPTKEADYQTKRAFQQRFQPLAKQLLVPVTQNTIPLPDAPFIGFLSRFYPKLSTFHLSFLDVKRLHESWKRYKAGLLFAVLGHRIHPIYGVYAPTRTTHLELFATWLRQYQGSKSLGIDVGTGCGVLAHLLCRSGFQEVRATDINPNSIHSVQSDADRLSHPITAVHTDLIGSTSLCADLIVFNPPWMAGSTQHLLDQALYFEQDLFPRFFDQALRNMHEHSRLVLVFSNILRLVQPKYPHPIETELARGRFTLVQTMHRRVKGARTQSGKRRKTREKVEIWELRKSETL